MNPLFVYSYLHGTNTRCLARYHIDPRPRNRSHAYVAQRLHLRSFRHHDTAASTSSQRLKPIPTARVEGPTTNFAGYSHCISEARPGNFLTMMWDVCSLKVGVTSLIRSAFPVLSSKHTAAHVQLHPSVPYASFSRSSTHDRHPRKRQVCLGPPSNRRFVHAAQVGRRMHANSQ